MKNSNIKISFKYVTNFNPGSFLYIKGLKNFTKLSNQKSNVDVVGCKHFILFIFLLKHLFKKNKITLFVKPKKSNIQNILRAPYKNKMSKHQLTFSRFFLNVSINILKKTPIVCQNIFYLVNLVNELKKFYSFFESNICFQHKSSINFSFFLNNNFII